MPEAEPAYPITSFNEFEVAYSHYIEEEQLEDGIKPVISCASLFRRPKPPILSYVPGFIYAGALNLIAGEPKAGKSTLAWYLTNSISLGTRFLGDEVRKTNVLYVTEQNEVSFRQEAESIPNFTTNENLYMLFPEYAPTVDWRTSIAYWGDKLLHTRSSVLVIDTFSSFASLPPGGENDSACIAERLMALKHLFLGKPNLAIVLVHHIRKPVEDPKNPRFKDFADLRDARGSSAIVGGVDHCLMLSKHQRNDNARNIHVEGRFVKEQRFSIVLTDNGYQDLNAREGGGFHGPSG
jgi:archaellum biogenesis ATPase FlaH